MRISEWSSDVCSSDLLFATDGGVSTTPVYEIGSPIFDKITLHLDPAYYPGQTFVIETNGNSSENRYIQSATLNGRALDRVWIPHDTVVKGGVLRLEMGKNPNTHFGASRTDAPPSIERTHFVQGKHLSIRVDSG